MSSFKLKCIKNGYLRIAKAGVIYEFVNGRTLWSDGSDSCRYEDAEAFFYSNKGAREFFVEIKDDKYSFKDIVAKIEPGEVYKSKHTIVTMGEDSSISIKHKSEKNEMITLENDALFELIHTISFAEAWAEIEKGEEVLNCIKGYSCKKKDGKMLIKFYSTSEEEGFEIENDTSLFSVQDMQSIWCVI